MAVAHPAGAQRLLPALHALALKHDALRVIRTDAGSDARELLLDLAAVPYAITDTKLWVAYAGASPARLARELQVRCRREVQVTWAPPDEIAAALTAAFDPDSDRTQALLEAQAHAWLARLGVANTTAGPDALWLEALSLASGRPRISLDRWQIGPLVRGLLPRDLLLELRAAPVALVGRVLLLAVAIDGRAATWRTAAAAVTAATGLTVQVVLAQARAVDSKVEALLGQAPATSLPEAVAQPSGMLGGLGRQALSRAGISGDVRRLARTDASLLSAEQTAAALTLAHVLPLPLARRFRCAVVGDEGGTLDLAVTEVTPPAAAAILTQLGGRPVRTLLLAEPEIERLLHRLTSVPVQAGDPAVPLSRLGEYLVKQGAITQAQLRDAITEQLRAGEPLGRVLVRTGLLSESLHAETLAIAQDVPLISLAQYMPPRGAASLLPEAFARANNVLAVRHDQGAPGGLGVFYVAMTDPGDSTLIAELESITGLHVRPLLAEPQDLVEAQHRDQRAAPRSLSAAAMRLLAALQVQQGPKRDGALDRAAIVRVRLELEAGAPADEALVRGGPLGANEAAALLAAVARLRPRSLWPHEQLVHVFDAVGTPVVQHRRIDPVDAVVARRIDLALAERLTALPVAVEHGRTIVAVADPFTENLQDDLRAALGDAFELTVGTREEVQAATRRTIGRRSLGDALVATWLITKEELEQALALARDTNVRLGKALLTLGYLNQDQLTQTLSDQFGLPVFDLSSAEVDAEVARAVPEELSRRAGVLPLAIDERQAMVAIVDPADSDALAAAEEALGLPLTLVLVSEQQMDAALQTLYRSEYAERASLELLSRTPEDSAALVWTRAQLIWIGIIAATILLSMLLRPIATATVLVTGATFFYTALSLYKFVLISRSLSGTLEETVTPEEAAALSERDLPIYTVLVPMYHEASVLNGLVEGLSRLDYPSTKLDVLLLLEEDDHETQAAAAAMRLPEGFRVLVVPTMHPKTKPKACNYGLLQATGELLVIYDAEDVPEPDQLRKAVAIFRRYDDRLVCIQSKLNYFNRDQNILTRWFTIEYSTWFDLLLPGLDRTGAPIPLGGTSNHFRTEALRQLGGWDPFNTTEDADLGLRVFKRGFRTVVMNSTTYEEANSNLHNWLRQRSRWVKGYMQTWLVHMRHPIRTLREIGFWPFFSFQMIVAGTWFSLLVNPIFWLLTMLWFLAKWSVIQQIFPAPIFYIGAFGLYVGNFTFVYVHVAGCLRREYYHLVKYALFVPVYWVLMSVAAWMAFRELLFKPHYWQKTQHGLFTGKARIPGARR